MRKRIRRSKNNLRCPICGGKLYRTKYRPAYGYCNLCGEVPIYLTDEKEVKVVEIKGLDEFCE